MGRLLSEKELLFSPYEPVAGGFFFSFPLLGFSSSPLNIDLLLHHSFGKLNFSSQIADCGQCFGFNSPCPVHPWMNSFQRCNCSRGVSFLRGTAPRNPSPTSRGLPFVDGNLKALYPRSGTPLNRQFFFPFRNSSFSDRGVPIDRPFAFIADNMLFSLFFRGGATKVPFP